MSETNSDYRQMRDAFNALGVEVGKLLALTSETHRRFNVMIEAYNQAAMAVNVNGRGFKDHLERIERKLKKRKKDRK